MNFGITKVHQWPFNRFFGNENENCLIDEKAAGFSEDSDFFPLNGPLSNVGASQQGNRSQTQQRQHQQQHQQPYLEHSSQQNHQDHFYYDTGQQPVKKSLNFFFISNFFKLIFICFESFFYRIQTNRKINIICAFCSTFFRFQLLIRIQTITKNFVSRLIEGKYLQENIFFKSHF